MCRKTIDPLAVFIVSGYWKYHPQFFSATVENAMLMFVKVLNTHEPTKLNMLNNSKMRFKIPMWSYKNSDVPFVCDHKSN